MDAADLKNDLYNHKFAIFGLLKVPKSKIEGLMKK